MSEWRSLTWFPMQVSKWKRLCRCVLCATAGEEGQTTQYQDLQVMLFVDFRKVYDSSPNRLCVWCNLSLWLCLLSCSPCRNEWSHLLFCTSAIGIHQFLFPSSNNSCSSHRHPTHLLCSASMAEWCIGTLLHPLRARWFWMAATVSPSPWNHAKVEGQSQTKP